MQIRELLKNNKISLRTYNICMEQQWHSSEDIRNYYNEYKHFDGIKNCGKRSMEELKRISSSDFFDRLQQEDVLNRQLLSSFETLTPLQKEIIDSYIQMITTSLPPRLKNTLDMYFTQGVSLQAFYKFYIQSKENAVNIRGIGRRNTLDLNIYFDKIKYFIIEISKVEDPDKIMVFKEMCVNQDIYPIENIPTEVTRLGFFKVVDWW